jgi:hypothetical protein
VQPAESFLPRFVTKSRLPIAAVLYDLIPEIIDVYPDELMDAYRVRRELIKHVDLILALSEQTKRDAIERLGVAPKRVEVIGAGASEYFHPPEPGDQPELLLAERVLQITKPYVFCVSGWSAHKNTEGLIDAWARLSRDIRDAHQLVVTCRLPPEAGTAWVDRARERGLHHDELVVTDYVDDDVLRALYQRARLFVLPSFYEGFGLPVLEAALCGCPAVTSNASAVPEVLQWAPASFAPEDLDEMASVVERGLGDEAFRRQLLEAGRVAATRHTWEGVAERTLAACARLGATTRRRRTPARRLAVVGSFARDGGFMAWSAELTRRLRRDVAVEWFATGTDRDATPRHHRLTTLGRTADPWSFDAIVYLVDESTHADVVDAALRYPGVVWYLAPPLACPRARELSGAERGRLVPPEVEARNMPEELAPFARAVPTRTASTDDLDAAIEALFDLACTPR